MDNVTYAIQDLHFGYGTTEVLSALNLNFKPGSLHAIVGPNGSGKSTLLDLMSDHILPTSGSILINDTLVRDYSASALSRLTALVPQEFDFNFPFTVRETVLMGRHPHIPRFSRPSVEDMHIVQTAMETADIGHLAERSLSELSGGEKQRTVFARALAQTTPALLLDEPTSSMDIRHALSTMAKLRILAREENRTIITILHDLNLAAAYCDHIIVLKNGRVHTQGDAATALTPNTIRDVFGVEANITRDTSNTLTISYTPKENS